jgi:AcrR family transcriptional regulator
MPAKATSASTRDNILSAATEVFTRYGYEGGSLEKISKSAKSVDRMVYYYFGSKEGLFIQVLENSYRRMNDAERKLKLDTSQPIDGLNRVIGFVLAYYRKNPEFITLLNLENLQRGKHIAKSERAREYSSPAIAIISELLQNGVAQKIFRKDVSARNVYLLIVATSYFYMSNRFTLSSFLGENLQTAKAIQAWQSFISSTVMRSVLLKPQTF